MCDRRTEDQRMTGLRPAAQGPRTAGFLGLQALITVHVTGIFVTLAATIVIGTRGIIAKLLALPE
jgi:hypothetical protein